MILILIRYYSHSGTVSNLTMKKYDESFKTEQIKNDSSLLMGNPFAAIIKSHKLIQHSVMILT